MPSLSATPFLLLVTYGHHLVIQKRRRVMGYYTRHLIYLIPLNIKSLDKKGLTI